jgi:hypothetical protein
MRLRVVELHRAGAAWEAVPAGLEEVAVGDGRRAPLPASARPPPAPIGDALLAAVHGCADSQLQRECAPLAAAMTAAKAARTASRGRAAPGSAAPGSGAPSFPPPSAGRVLAMSETQLEAPGAAAPPGGGAVVEEEDEAAAVEAMEEEEDPNAAAAAAAAGASAAPAPAPAPAAPAAPREPSAPSCALEPTAVVGTEAPLPGSAPRPDSCPSQVGHSAPPPASPPPPSPPRRAPAPALLLAPGQLLEPESLEGASPPPASPPLGSAAPWPRERVQETPAPPARPPPGAAPAFDESPALASAPPAPAAIPDTAAPPPPPPRAFAPPGFDLEVEAPAGGAPAAAADDFDFYAPSQAATQGDARHAWAAGLPAPAAAPRAPPPLFHAPPAAPPAWQPPAAAAAPQRSLFWQAAAPPQPAPPPPPQQQPAAPPPPPQQQQQPAAPPQQQEAGCVLATRRAGGFLPPRPGGNPAVALRPYELPAGRAPPPPGFLDAITADLRAIRAGRELAPRPAAAAPAAPPPPQQQQPQQQLQLANSASEPLSEAVTAQLEALEAAALARGAAKRAAEGAAGAAGEGAAKRPRASPLPAAALQALREPPPPVMVPMTGFSTGRGAVVHVSAAALAAARAAAAGAAPFEDDPPATAPRAAAAPADAAPASGTVPMTGFSTGRGAPVQVSAAALAAAAARAAETVPPTPEAPPAAGSAPAPGFSTGRGAAVRVSEAARDAAARLLQAADAAAATSAGAETPPQPQPPLAAIGSVPAAACEAGAGLSRFAPGPRPVSAAAPRARVGSAGPAGPAAGSARKFVTPRPFAGPAASTRSAAAAAAAAAAQQQQQQLAAPPAARAVHDLRHSALAEELAAVRAGLPPRGPPRRGAAPLDARRAARFRFPPAAPGADGAGWERLRLRLLEAGARSDWATDAWALNHFRWAVWKLARCELAAGPAAAGRLLTPDILEDELRRRYARELGAGGRPFLAAALRGDEPPGRAAVLAVAGWAPAGADGAPRLELTDGWYSVAAVLDAPLAALAAAGRLRPGMKLRVTGAEWASPPAQGAEPLDAMAAGAAFRLAANATRPAPTGARLGRARGGAPPAALRGVHPRGGPVPRLAFVVLRRFPELVRARLPSGVDVLRTPAGHARAEARAARGAAAIEEAVAAEAAAAEAARCRELLAAGGLRRSEEVYARMAVGAADAAAGAAPASQAGGALAEDAAAARFAEARGAELEAERAAATRQRLGEELPERAQYATPLLPLLVGEVRHAGRAAAGRAAAAAAVPGGAGGRLCAGGGRFALLTVWRAEELGLDGVREGEAWEVSGLAPAPNDLPFGAGGWLAALPALATPAGRRRGRWRRLAAAPEALPRALAAAAAPRPRLGVAALGAHFAAAAAAAPFDFVGVLLAAGAVVAPVAAQGGESWQWLFLADASAPLPTDAEGGFYAAGLDATGAARAPWLLAVQLRRAGGEEDVDFWPAGGGGLAPLALRELELAGLDSDHRFWKAAGGRHTAAGPPRGGEAAELAAWAGARGGALAALRARVLAVIG